MKVPPPAGEQTTNLRLVPQTLQERASERKYLPPMVFSIGGRLVMGNAVCYNGENACEVWSVNIYEEKCNDELLEKLIAMSAEWEAERSTYGYRKNERSDIEGNRIFLAQRDGEIRGYLLGHEEKSERASSIMTSGTPYFEIEELYVVPGCRNEGIGRALFLFAEQTVKAAGIEYIMLSTATKNYRSILHFYIDELGMDFWSARLFKKL